MHETELKNRFIQRRADGWTLDAIATSLQIPKSTLWRWDRQEKTRIHRMKIMVQEERDAEFNQDRECQIGALRAYLEMLEDGFADNVRINMRSISLKDHFNLIKSVRAELDRLRIEPATDDSEPDAEYPLQFSPENPEPIPECEKLELPAHLRRLAPPAPDSGAADASQGSDTSQAVSASPPNARQ
ncbi:MAG TPA: helix-turn-helix domain-containing protein [Verrucomicrobiae bacterium]